MIDIKLGVSSHDIELDKDTKDILLLNGLDQVRQHLKIRLAFIYNEWFLDGDAGVQFYQYVHVKNPDIALIDALIKTEIIETPDVHSILTYRSSFDNTTRQFTVDFSVDTVYGETTITMELI